MEMGNTYDVFNDQSNLSVQMECHVCLNRRDLDLRPCGHTLCAHCLLSMMECYCPICRKAFKSADSAPGQAFSAFVGRQAKTIRKQVRPLLARLRGAEADCSRRVERFEAIKSLLQESQRLILQDRMQLEVSRAVLEAASFKSAGEMKHAVKLAKQALAATEAEAAVLEMSEMPEKAEVLFVVEGMKLRGRGTCNAVQQAVTALQLLLDEVLESDGTTGKLPSADGASVSSGTTLPSNDLGEEVQSTAPAAVPVDSLDVEDLTWSRPHCYLADKVEVLQEVRRAAGVRRLGKVYCHKDPNWTAELLRSAKPALETLQLHLPQPRHLQEVFAMQKLHTLSVSGTNALFEGPPPLVAEDQPSSLQRLCLVGPDSVRRETVLSVLTQHGATLREVELGVGTAGDEPECCQDLESLMEPLTALSILVLCRDWVHHDPESCKDQLSKVRRKVTTSAIVLCTACDNVPPFDWFD